MLLLFSLLPARSLTIGSKKFTESVILGEILARTASGEGIPVRHRRELGGTRILWQALLAGDIDIYPEYSGTLLHEILARHKFKTADSLRRYLKKLGLGMSADLGFNNTYALGTTISTAQRLHLEKISDLAAYPNLRYGFSNEFMARADGWPSLRRAYNLSATDVRGLDHDLAYRGLRAGSIDVMEFYTTDAEIDYYKLFVLQDDRRHFPAYRAMFLYRLDALERYPALKQALKLLSGAIDGARMSAMNADAKIRHQPAEAVAARFVAGLTGKKTTTVSQNLFQRIGQRSAEHLFLVLVSMALAILIALPLGIWAAFRPRAGRIILSVTGILQTIPSLALLVFMIPLLGIGEKPAIFALFLYSLLPIVRNTESGLKDIPQGIRDSAEVIGLMPGARLRHVYLPLASRSILSGIKTATVINIGTATLGALIGAGGYGQPILTGIRLDDMGLILEGAVPAALLALTAQGILGWLEKRIG